MSIPVETFFMDDNIEGTLQSRIQQIIARGILSGRFRKGEKLPSTRKLAKHLKISRVTVTLAYTELQSNDYLSFKEILDLSRCKFWPYQYLEMIVNNLMKH